MSHIRALAVLEVDVICGPSFEDLRRSFEQDSLTAVSILSLTIDQAKLGCVSGLQQTEDEDK